MALQAAKLHVDTQEKKRNALQSGGQLFIVVALRSIRYIEEKRGNKGKKRKKTWEKVGEKCGNMLKKSGILFKTLRAFRRTTDTEGIIIAVGSVQQIF